MDGPLTDPEYAKESNAARIIGVVTFFHSVALTVVASRIYVRTWLVRSFGVDDAIIVIAVLLAMVSWICLILQLPYGLGHHGLTIPVDRRTKFEQISFWKTVISDGFAMGLLRISMALSLLRLNKDTKWYRWSLFAVIGFVVLYTIQAVAWLFVYCNPYSGWWEFQWLNPFDPRCYDFNLFLNLTYWNIACNVFTDICLGTLPIPIIWNLQMKLRLRLYVIGILNLGYFSVICGICKAVFMLTTGGDPDNTFDYWVHFWQNLQLNIGIIAASASFLKPLVGRILKINSTIGYYGTSGNAGSGRPYGSQTIGSRASKRRTIITDRAVIQDYELDKFHGTIPDDSKLSPIAERTRPVRSPIHDSPRSIGAFYEEGTQLDNSSEEIILQKPEPLGAGGIVLKREYTVKYGER